MSDERRPFRWKEFEHRDFLEGRSLDIFSLLHWLFAKQNNEGVRDFLTHKLYDIPRQQDHVLDFILPQLCHLFSQWTEEQGRNLGRYLKYRSCSSVILALKVIFNLHANSAYGTPEQSRRCLSLLEECEMSMVNGKIAGAKEPEMQAMLRQKKRPEQREQKTAAPTTQPRANDSGVVVRMLLRAPSSSEGPAPGAMVMADSPASRPPTAQERREMTEGQEMELEPEEIELMKNKRVRSDYFNKELKLVYELNSMSDTLAKIPRKHGRRQAELNKMLNHLNKSISGLYFPSNLDCRHYKVLQINVEHCRTLNSRDKAPFLLLFEVLTTGKNVYEEDIYLPYSHPSPSSAASKRSECREAKEVGVRAAFGELWENKKARIRAVSRWGSEPNWDLRSVIFKGGDDCRQEVLAMQLIKLFHEAFQEAQLPLKLRPYSVLVTSGNSGLIETIPNATSIDSLKKDVPGFTTLARFFEDYFGPKGSAAHDVALRNFVESMAAYSVVCYLLQIKDRHNGNIMLDSQGHIIHIDFGFALSNSPGGNLNFESCPFKLTQEFVEVLDGEASEAFALFKIAFIRGYLEARYACAHKVLLLVETMMQGSNMACFLGGAYTLVALRNRFMLDATETECINHASALIEESVNNWRTVQYDKYQELVNDIK